jgi:hypothetical protein
MERQMIYSAMRTPDGTLLESLHRHDYREHLDKNGVYYMIDGGLDYVRYSGDGQQEWIQYYDDDDYEIVRTHWHWGRNYDKDMNLLPKTEWVKLCDLTDGHLKALEDYPRISGWCRELINKEIEYRWKNQKGISPNQS